MVVHPAGTVVATRDLDLDELFGVRHRERAQPERVEQLEDGGVRADAQRQRQDRDRREAGFSRSRRAP